MIKKEALAAMAQGAKITHTSFTSEEFIKAGNIRDIEFEDGCRCSFEDFWEYRTEEVWESGWSIWK